VIRRIGAACVFLSTLASAQEGAPARHRPMLSTFSASKARTLMRDRLPCAGCHVIAGLSGGGRIGPDLSRVADRRSPEYVRRMIEDPHGAVPGTIMPKVPMPAPMRELVVAYLARTAPTSSTGRSDAGAVRTPREPAVPVATSEAPALYATYCAPCHGAKGRGDGPNARHLPVAPARHVDSAFMSRRSDDRLFDAIYAGGYPLGRSAMMPPYGETLTRPEVWALVRHLRVLCRCSGPAWSTDGDRSGSSRHPR
jgi:mono/diheme cytochrome c family protein